MFGGEASGGLQFESKFIGARKKLEKHMFSILLRGRLVAPDGAARYRLRSKGERAGGDPRARVGGASSS